MSTPSAPPAKAARMNCGSARPEHMRRMMRTFGAYLSRETPARSAAVYVHQLQKNATMRGCHPGSCMGEHSFDFAEDFVVLEKSLSDRAGWAGGDARPAALAEGGVDGRLALLLIEADGRVGAEREARLAARAVLLGYVGRVRLLLDVAAVDQRHRLGRGRPGLGYAVGDVLRALAAPGDEHPVRERRDRRQLRVLLEEPALGAAAHVEEPAHVLRI